MSQTRRIFSTLSSRAPSSLRSTLHPLGSHYVARRSAIDLHIRLLSTLGPCAAKQITSSMPSFGSFDPNLSWDVDNSTVIASSLSSNVAENLAIGYFRVLVLTVLHPMMAIEVCPPALQLWK